MIFCHSHRSRNYKASCSRPYNGNAIAELPLAIWLLITVLTLPFCGLVTMGYRAILFYFATRECCHKAAKSKTYSQAQASGNAAFKSILKECSGILNASETCSIIVQPINGKASQVFNTALAQGSINTSNSVYFILVTAKGDILPLLDWGPRLGMNVPGLTQPFPLQIRVESYAENPQGLTI